MSSGGRKPFLGNLEEELVEKIIDEREKYHHVPCKLITVWAQQLAHMDETPIWADMPSKTTVDQRGLETVPIKSTRHEKQRMTVCLAIKADGSKMKPFVVIPGKSEIAAIKGAI